MGTKGVRSKRGVGELYDQVKTEKIILLLTKEGKQKLDAKVEKYSKLKREKISRSEYIERMARDTL